MTSSGLIPLLAHRGYAARFPENSRVALRAAVDAGAENIEFDIQLSADQVPFLLHDEDFRRTGGVNRRITDLDAAEVSAIAIGEPARLGGQFCEEHVPRLAEVVEDLLGWPAVKAFVELKRQSIERFGVKSVVQAVLAELQPVIDRCVIISFEAAAITTARAQSDCRIGWALRRWNDDSRRIAEEIKPDYLFCNATRLPPEPEPLWAGPWTWVVYEITEPDAARKLAARGVGMIETMAITELAAGIAASPGQRGVGE